MEKRANTIVALATPPGQAALAVVRVSGDHSINILQAITERTIFIPRKMYYGKIKDKNKIIDDVQYVFFSAPKSYTGESSFEIYCHGNELLANEIIALIRREGAVLARRGEFSRRAYMNGKMSLVQAEGVAELIAAESKEAIWGARAVLGGRLEVLFAEIKEQLLTIKINAEVEIDFNEADDFNERSNKIYLNAAIEKIEELLLMYSEYEKLKRGIRICICGDTNSGKSTLFNFLLTSDKAIVSSEEGTTRDIIEAETKLFGKKVFLFDTAGIRITSNKIEKEGIKRAKELIEKSEIILYLFDASRQERIEMPLPIQDKEIIFVANKKDLLKTKQLELFKKDKQYLAISAKDGDIGPLNEKLQQLLLKNASHELLIVNKRQKEKLEGTLKNLFQAKTVINTPELLSYEIDMAINKMENLLGTITNNEILDGIFENFCIGK